MADYKADRTKVPVDVAGGVIPGEFNGKLNRTDEVVGRRITLHDGNSTCQRHEQLIPPHATDMLRDLITLVSATRTSGCLPCGT